MMTSEDILKDFLYSLASASGLILPILTVLFTLLILATAYRKGLFSREPIKNIPTEPATIIVHGDVSGTIGITPEEIQKIALSAANVDEYHRQSISQSAISFWFSLVLATLGFLIILTSIFTYSDKAGYLGVVAGTIVEAVAALFFHQTNRARALMADFFDRLRADRKLEESLKLCSSTSNSIIQDALRVRLALHFSGIENSEQALKDILTLTSQHQKTANCAVAKTAEDRC